MYPGTRFVELTEISSACLCLPSAGIKGVCYLQSGMVNSVIKYCAKLPTYMSVYQKHAMRAAIWVLGIEACPLEDKPVLSGPSLQPQ